MYRYSHFLILFHVGQYRVLSRVPCVIQQVFLIYFIYCCLHSVANSCPTLCDSMDFTFYILYILYILPLQAPLSSTLSWNLFKFIATELVMLSNHFIICCCFLLLPSIFPSELVFRIKWAKYWRFSFSISPSNEYPGLIAFRIDWFDLLAVRGTLKSFLQHHNLKAPHTIQLFLVS